MKLQSIEASVRKWMEVNADTHAAAFGLSVVSFFEASLLPLPPSAFMVTMVVLGRRQRWVYLALLTTVTSVLGGLFGYVLGSVLYDTVGVVIIEYYNLQDEIKKVGELFADNAFWSVFVGAFTPIPYKAFTIGAGFFELHVVSFVVASFLGRGLRFFVLSYLAKVFGEYVVKRIFHYFAIVTLIAVLTLVFVGVWASV